ncbi:MAG TPA: response regulator [Tepidisphaeraceae bacterium]|nr:response regulator [Tepidisphaeraceae bacterium]
MRRILLVDDSPMAREPLAKVLAYEGYDVLAVSNGLEAIETLRDHPIDLLLLDVIMPKMNGIQLLENLRGQEQWKNLNVIALTGSMDRAHISRLHDLGVSEILIKARFKIEELLNRVKAHFPTVGD